MKEVTLDQLFAGGILKFGKIDCADIILFLGGLKKFDSDIKYVDTLPNENTLNQYMQITNGEISIRDGFSLNTRISPFSDDNDYTLEKFLTNLRGKIIGKYLDELDMDDFVLRKVRLLIYLPVKQLNEFFNTTQQEILMQLQEKGMIGKRWNNDIPCQDYEEFYITQSGRVQLFMKDYKDDIEAFVTMLKELNYNTNLMHEFLMTQEIQSNPENILSIEAFINFGNTYDRYLENNNDQLRLRKLDITKQ